MELRELLSRIPAPEALAAQAARERWDARAKPLGASEALREAAVRMAALHGGEAPSLDRRTLLVFCADSDASARNTAAAARALALGEAALCRMARAARCRVQPVDMGIQGFAGCKGLLSCRIRGGVMDREQCVSTIRAGAGIAMVQETDILALGALGGGMSAASAASILPELKPDAPDTLELLMQAGGPELAAMCGAVLGAAVCRRPLVLDGVESAVAALCAQRLCPDAAAVLLAGYCKEDPLCDRLLKALELRPLARADFGQGEGGGAIAALPLLDMALAVYRHA